MKKIIFSRRRALGGVLAVSGLLYARQMLAAPAEADSHLHVAHDTHDAHAGHKDMHEHHAKVPDDIRRTEVNFQIPPLTLVRNDGKTVAFPAALDDGRPVVLDFIYTSCTTICPLSSQLFSQFQEKLGAERAHVNMVSISIDPEFDTPQRMTDYAKKFDASPQWQHYTGTVEASVAIQKAFDVYRGDKMNHFPVTFMRAAPGKPWVRMDGFVSAAELLEEYRRLVKGHA
jgi:protein SCO1/2